MHKLAVGLLALLAVGCSDATRDASATGETDMLPSWNDTPTKTAIVDFVDRVTNRDSADYVLPSDRIAVFDNDGTLWSEKPVYFQFLFAIDRAQERSEENPGWASTPALEAAARGDLAAIEKGGVPALLEIATATHSGVTLTDFARETTQWIETATHPQKGRRYRDMTYVPMRELLDYLRANGFKVFIVSGGGIDFMRTFAEEAYGVPSENVIGTYGDAEYRVVDGKGQIMKSPKIAFLDDKAAKPIAIARHIGKRPIFVGGNSDGDFEMAEWATTGESPSLAVLVHHTDGEREFAYDRESLIGALDRGLDEASGRGWVLVDMARDWKAVWPENSGTQSAPR